MIDKENKRFFKTFDIILLGIGLGLLTRGLHLSWEVDVGALLATIAVVSYAEDMKNG